MRIILVIFCGLFITVKQLPVYFIRSCVAQWQTASLDATNEMFHVPFMANHSALRVLLRLHLFNSNLTVHPQGVDLAMSSLPSLLSLLHFILGDFYL